MVAVAGYPNILSEMTVLKEGNDIGLTTYGKLKQSISKENSLQYVFYSIYEFNLTVSILYGKLNVTIVDPDGSHIFE